MTSNNLTHFPSINLVSFNANGLGQDSKRKLAFDKIKSLDSIILLQETHCTKTLEKKWEKDWEVKIYFANGSSNSGRVATLFPPNIDHQLCEKQRDDIGKFYY